MPKDHFGEHLAKRYDERYTDMADPAVVDPIVAFLAGLAGDGAALELGIGTGRIALPLKQRGVRVRGIDLSAAMVARLRAKPGLTERDITGHPEMKLARWAARELGRESAARTTMYMRCEPCPGWAANPCERNRWVHRNRPDVTNEPRRAPSDEIPVEGRRRRQASRWGR